MAVHFLPELILTQGEEFSQPYQWSDQTGMEPEVPRNLTGWNGAATFKTAIGATPFLVVPLDFGEDGMITLHLTSDETLLFPHPGTIGPVRVAYFEYYLTDPNGKGDVWAQGRVAVQGRI